MKKVLLLTAPRPEQGYSPVHFGDNRPPQGLGYLAEYLKQNGHHAEIIDLYAFGGKSLELNPTVNQEEIGQQMDIDIFHQIRELNPDFIGMYVHTMSFESACRLSKEIQEQFPGIRQICGGPHPTIKPETMPDSFDFVVSGVGEYVLLDIVEGRAVERMQQGRHMTSEELEHLPWPDFDLFWGKPYNYKLSLFNKDIEPVLTISSSRGCPFRCSFCGVKDMYPKYITVSAEHVFNRMVYLYEKYGVTTYYFREDNFTANLSRLDKFCDLILDSPINFQWVCESRVRELSEELITKISNAGCIGLYIGCESGSDAVLELMKKDETVEDYLEKFPILHANNISTYTTWVYGVPGETSQDRKLTDELIKKLNPVKVDQFVYIGIPTSELYFKILNNNTYEYIDHNGFMYPEGYLSLSIALYGENDPRVQYVKKLYKENQVVPLQVEW